MTKLNKAELKKERNRIKVRAKGLIEQIKKARNAKNWDLFDELDHELDILRRKQKHVLYQLGEYKFKDHETVEYAPGQFMKASEYYWLLDG